MCKHVLFTCLFCFYTLSGFSSNIETNILSGIIIHDIIEVNPTCGIDNGSLTISAEGPPGSILQYSIDGGFTFQTSNFFDNLDDQDYLVIVIDQNFCSSVPESPQLVNTGDVFIDLLEFECQTGAGNVVNIVPILSGSSETVYYTWEDENGFVSDASELINVPAGTYYLHVENNVGCSDIAEITTDECCAFEIDCSQLGDISYEFVQDIAPIDPVFLDTESSLDADLFEDLNGTIGTPCFPLIIHANDDISGACGGLPFEGFRNYVITDGVDTITCQQEIFILDSLSACSGFDPNITFNLAILDCNKTSIDLNITSQTDHSVLEITLPSGEVLSSDNETLDTPGDYSWVLMDTRSGCTVQGTETIYADFAEPEISIVGGALTCLSPSTSLSVNTNLTLTSITWTDPEGNMIASENLVADKLGEYTATAVATNGCVSSASYILTGDVESLNIELNFIDSLNCNQSSGIASITLDGEPASVLWINAEGQSLGSQTSLQYSEGGNYTVIVIDEAGCESMSSFVVVEDFEAPSAEVSTSLLTCETTNTVPSLSSTHELINVQWFDDLGNNLGSEPILSEAGNYYVVYTSTNGCESTTNFEVISDNEMPMVNLIDIETINCINTSVTIVITNDEAESYRWFDSNGNEIANNDLITSEAGSYILIATAENGCTTELNIDIPIDTIAPSFSLSDGLINCISTNATLSADNLVGASEIQWLDASDNLITDELSFTTTEAGIYQCVAIGENGCTTNGFSQISIDTISPDFSTYHTLITCNNNEGSVGIIPSSNQTTTAWYSNENLISTSNEISATAPNDYVVIVTDPENGCKKEENLSIEEETNVPENILFDLSKASCDNDIFFFENFEVVGGYSPYTVLLDGSEIDPTNTELEGTDIQSVEIIDNNGCKVDTSLQLVSIGTLSSWLSDPHIDLHIDDEGQIDLSYNQADSLIESIVWNDPNGNLSCDDCKSPKVFDLEENVSISVTVTNIYGCESTSEIYLRRTYAPRVMPPNIISPWADFTNKHFTLFTNDEVVEIVYLYIYDRYGELMFEEHNIPPNEPGEGWDCTFKGEFVTPSVYTWIAQLRVIDGTFLKRGGDVTVIK